MQISFFIVIKMQNFMTNSVFYSSILGGFKRKILITWFKSYFFLLCENDIASISCIHASFTAITNAWLNNSKQSCKHGFHCIIYPGCALKSRNNVLLFIFYYMFWRQFLLCYTPIQTHILGMIALTMRKTKPNQTNKI